MQEILTARGFASLGNETRLAIFRLLVRAGEDGTTTGQIGASLGIPLSTLAHHLDTLAQAGLVRQRKSGRQVINSANYPALQQLIDYLMSNCCEGLAENDPDEARPADTIAERAGA